MTKDELVRDWVEQSDRDVPVMETLFASGHYQWALFVGHLVTEKLLKAYYIKKVDTNIPFIHDRSYKDCCFVRPCPYQGTGRFSR